MGCTLADIENAPERILELTPDEAMEMASRLAALQVGLVIRAHAKRPDIGAERLLAIGEAARRMSVTANWLRRHASSLPFAVKMGKEWRFNESGLVKYLRQRMQG